MIKVGIVGGTGYTGVELLRLLAVHPQVQLTAITSRKEDGLPVADMFPSLRGRVSLAFSARTQVTAHRAQRASSGMRPTPLRLVAPSVVCQLEMMNASESPRRQHRKEIHQ